MEEGNGEERKRKEREEGKGASTANWDGTDGKRGYTSTPFHCPTTPHLIVGMKLPPQWINCDLRTFDYSVLGKFHVIMADPPWDIHMSVRSTSSVRVN